MSDETDAPVPIFTLDFGEDGTVDLFTPEEIISWVEGELGKWQWLQQQTHGDGPAQGAIQAFTSLYQENSKYIQQLRQQISQPTSRSIIQNIQSSISNNYKQGRFILSTGSKGQFVNKLRETNPKVAAHAFGYFTNTQGIRSDVIESLKGNLAAWAFDFGIQGTVEPERRALVSLKKQWDSEFEATKRLNVEVETSLSKGQEDLRSLLEDYQQHIADARETMHQHNSAVSAELDEALKDAKTKLSEIEDTYDTKLALQAPVAYWSSKEAGHKQQATVSARIAGLSGVLALGAIIGLAWTLMGKDVHPPYFDIVTLAAVAVACFWILRLLVRNYLIQSHLRDDAAERVFMTNTYLSLQQGGQEMTDDDRHLILSALFRSATAAPGSDETNPPVITELARLLKR